jgi:hypothetical protein
MLAQATGFALLAAVSPTALLVMAIFLASANPRTTALFYVTGAVVMTVAMSVAVLFLLRGVGLDQPRQHEPRYALRFGLGILALAGALIMSRRKPRPPEERKETTKKPGLVSRLTKDPRPRTAFLAGVLLFAPSATFIAAVQVVATARAAVPVTVGALVIVIALTVLTVWLPLLAYLAAPGATTRALRNANGWIRANGKWLLSGALWIGGVALVVNGALGLWR